MNAASLRPLLLVLLAGSRGSRGFSAVAPPASSPPAFFSPRVSKVTPSSDGTAVDVRFSSSDGDDDGETKTTTTTYRFHSLWLRDACRDARHVVGNGVGERILTSTPVAGSCDVGNVKALDAESSDDGGEVTIRWNGASSTEASTYDADFLWEYADIVARSSNAAAADAAENAEDAKPVEENEMSWLKPYTGYPHAPAPLNPKLWTNENENDGVEFVRFDHDEVLSDPSENLKLLKELMGTGVVLVENTPPPAEDDAGSTLKAFVDRTMGGLQKDPTRDQPNWQITRKVGATSISYDHDKRLNGHTDSSVPPHGVPGIVLSMHYVAGRGANTLTDGFAAAKKLGEVDPEGFQLLVDYGYDTERDFVGSRVDSAQNHYKSLKVRRQNKLFELDDEGNLSKIMYNEVFRLPLTLPYEVFPKWYAAFDKFVSLVHDESYQRTVPMEAGTVLLMNNWRVFHGRAGGRATSDRKVVGGTILRESFYSRARDLTNEVAGREVPCAWLQRS